MALVQNVLVHDLYTRLFCIWHLNITFIQYIHRYIHAYNVHTHKIHTHSLHMHMFIHSNIHINILTHTHTYICTYIHANTYKYSCRHTHIHTGRQTGDQSSISQSTGNWSRSMCSVQQLLVTKTSSMVLLFCWFLSVWKLYFLSSLFFIILCHITII